MRPHPEEVPVSDAERIAYAYRPAGKGDAWTALVTAIEDAFADLAEAERRTQRRDRLVSEGCIRARLNREQA